MLGRPLAVDTRKALAIVAYLVATERIVSREVLAALLWPESDGADASSALRRTLSVLKRGLGGRGLTIERATVALRPVDLDVDLWRFRSALERVRRHGHGPDLACPTCIASLDEAVAAGGAEFLDGFSLRDSEPFDEWQLEETAAHRHDLASTLERLARGRAADRDWPAAITAGRRWLELDGLHEPAHRLLMTALARAGEPAAAISQYRDCVRILGSELGVAPLPETTDLYEAIRAGGVLPEPEDARTVDAPPIQARGGPSFSPSLVGRDDELGQLDALISEVGPDGRQVVVEGEPGIGKTRLVAEAVARSRARGAVALEARAYAGEAAIPLGAISELIRMGLDRSDAASHLQDVRPDLLAAASRLLPLPAVAAERSEVPEPFNRSRLIEGLAEVLTVLVRGPIPGVIWVDDLHLADSSTVDVLAFLAHRMRRRPLALVVSWREEELPDGVAARWMEARRDGLGSRIILGRLDRPAVTELAGEALGPDATPERIDELYAESEGLPLYVVEALAAGGLRDRAIPGGVLALLRARVAAVDGIAGQLLASAAVIGRSFDLESARAAAGRTEEETVAGLEELARRGLIREVGAPQDGDIRFDFAHGRLRDVAYEAMGLARRRLLHRRVAESLAGPGQAARAGGIQWALVAHHETLAGRSTAAAEAHRRAGEEARRVYANREAREHLEAAIALGHPAVSELDEELGVVLTLLGDYADAIAHLEAAAARAGTERQPGIEHRLGLVHARRGDWSRSDSHLQAAIAALDAVELASADGSRPAAMPAAGTSVARSRILADRSAVAHRRGDDAAARALAGEALDRAEAADDDAGIAQARNLRGILARGRGELDEAAAELELALDAADRATARGAAARVDDRVAERADERGDDPSDPTLRIAALNTLALVHAAAGDPAAAIPLTEEALRLCERQGDRHRQAALENNLADLLHATGRPDEAMDHLKRAVAIFADVGGRPGELEPEIWKLVEW